MFPYELGGGFPFNYKWSNGSINLNDGNSDKIKIRLRGLDQFIGRMKNIHPIE